MRQRLLFFLLSLMAMGGFATGSLAQEQAVEQEQHVGQQDQQIAQQQEQWTAQQAQQKAQQEAAAQD